MEKLNRKNEEKPRVSVIMGVYNAKNKRMINQSLKSVFSQTFQNFELIICDDGSTNLCAAYLKKIAQKSEKVRLIRNEKNMGLAYSLNRCLDMAQGEYIARMDIDDISSEDRFEKQVIFLDKHPSFAFVGSSIILFDEEGEWGTRKYKACPVKKDFLRYSPFVHPSAMFRREVLQSVGGYCTRWYTRRTEDYDLFLRLYQGGYIGYNIQELLYRYREGEDTYDRRVYQDRIAEAYVRMIGFWKLGLYPVAIPFVLKPLCVGIVPQNWIRRYRKWTYKRYREGKDLG